MAVGSGSPEAVVPPNDSVHDTHPLLAREGWVHIAIAVIVAIVVTATAGWLWASPAWVAVLFVLQFFRDPTRTIPQTPGAVMSPADGKVVAIGPTHDPYLGRPAQRISVFMNVFSVHSNRVPVNGVVREIWYHAGSFLNAALDKASAENERNAIWIKTDDEDDVVCVQIAGLIARRILCYVGQNDTVARGQRYGFIRFGSRVDLYLPRQADVRVLLGQNVTAGVDVVAALEPEIEN